MELGRKVLLPVAAVLALGNMACEKDTGDSDEAQQTPSPSFPPAAVALAPKPRDVMQLKQVPADAEGRQRAWTPQAAQPWGAEREVQVDSRDTKPVGGPVGIYSQPRQDRGGAVAEVQDGQEFPAVCYTDEQGGAQFIRNDSADGSYVWLRLDADRNGQPDAYLPATNAGFTGIAPGGQPDGTIPRC
jgi:hypothetical protein